MKTQSRMCSGQPDSSDRNFPHAPSTLAKKAELTALMQSIPALSQFFVGAACICVCVCACTWRREANVRYLLLWPSMKLELTDWLDWLGLLVPVPSVLGLQMHIMMPSFLHGYWASKLIFFMLVWQAFNLPNYLPSSIPSQFFFLIAPSNI